MDGSVFMYRFASVRECVCVCGREFFNWFALIFFLFEEDLPISMMMMMMTMIIVIIFICVRISLLVSMAQYDAWTTRFHAISSTDRRATKHTNCKISNRREQI